MEFLCTNCFKKINQNDICPYCNKPLNRPQDYPFLPVGTSLANRYIVGNALKMDGEGLSYVGFDKTKNSKVFIREFFPVSLCERSSDFKNVTINFDKKKYFRAIFQDFLKYFRSVARIRNIPLIISVYDIFEENKTAYVISEWIDGEPLDVYTSKLGGYMKWEEAKILFMPLLSSLSIMESSGVKHLGIAPSNLIITPNKKMRLVGFATKYLRSLNSPVEAELFEGCSAMEQYVAGYDSSETTDVYGFAATLFFALTGEYPLCAQKRKNSDKLLMPQDIVENLPENVICALANALKIFPNSRTISFETMRAELSDSPVLRVCDIDSSEEKFVLEQHERNVKKKNSYRGVISCISALLFLLVALAVYWFWLRDNSINTKNSGETTSDAVVDSTQLNTEDVSVQKIAAPDLTGKRYDSLQEKPDPNYVVMLMAEEYSDSVSEGCVISQNPNYGEEIQIGTPIAVKVSKGPKQVVLPEISGKTLSEVSQLLTSLKLIPVQSSDFSTEFKEGTVIGYKNYKAGEKIDKEIKVDIVVSRGSI